MVKGYVIYDYAILYIQCYPITYISAHQTVITGYPIRDQFDWVCDDMGKSLYRHRTHALSFMYYFAGDALSMYKERSNNKHKIVSQ